MENTLNTQINTQQIRNKYAKNNQKYAFKSAKYARYANNTQENMLIIRKIYRTCK
jgi:hypothetical protein